jgi:putative ATPase
LHKSIRGSDADAALYWLARMLAGGESPLYVARRVVRACRGRHRLCRSTSRCQALAAKDVYDFPRLAEGELAIAQAVIYLATAPKSNAVYVAYGEARASAAEHGSLTPPAHILNAPTRLMQDLGYGAGYEYDHATEEAFSGQNYFPEGMARREFLPPEPTRLREGNRKSASPIGPNSAPSNPPLEGGSKFFEEKFGEGTCGQSRSLPEGARALDALRAFDSPSRGG